jgi:hypothetical protein
MKTQQTGHQQTHAAHSQGSTEGDASVPEIERIEPQGQRHSTQHLGISARSKSLKKADLKKGDVVVQRSRLLLSETSLLVIRASQNLLRLTRPAEYGAADPTLVHTGMCVESNSQDPHYIEAATPEFNNKKLRPGEYDVYRHKDAAIAEQAADITKAWVNPDTQWEFQKHKPPIAFAASLVLGSELHADNVETIDTFAQQAQDQPPQWIVQDSTICSELTASAYQAAAKLDHDATVTEGIPTVFNPIFPTVAHRTMPSAMVQAMESRGQFEKVGTIHVDEPSAPNLVSSEKDKTQ